MGRWEAETKESLDAHRSATLVFAAANNRKPVSKKKVENKTQHVKLSLTSMNASTLIHVKAYAHTSYTPKRKEEEDEEMEENKEEKKGLRVVLRTRVLTEDSDSVPKTQAATQNYPELHFQRTQCPLLFAWAQVCTQYTHTHKHVKLTYT